jgi:two-component system chemotaxis response regulator CheB
MSIERRIRVLIVEDSTVVRMLLKEIIGSHPRLAVAAAVATAEEAIAMLPTLKPDVISLDIRLPGMNGMEATRRIMAMQPTPIVVVSASVEAEDLKISMNALRAGALAVVEKPTGVTNADYAVMAARLCRQLVIMSEVPVIRLRGWHGVRERAPGPREEAGRKTAPAPAAGGYRALGIVASTGGPNAVLNVLQSLGADCPLPILLVQHITPSFLAGFCVWLADMCPFEVVIASNGQVALSGHVYVSPAEHHIAFDNGCVRITDGPPVSGQRPSGTILLRSLAQSLGNRAIGVILTGMGDDGAEGMRAIHDAGGYTIAEDESTAVVYGMPAVAMRLGGVTEQLPLPRIGPRLREICNAAQMAK